MFCEFDFYCLAVYYEVKLRKPLLSPERRGRKKSKLERGDENGYVTIMTGGQSN